MKEKGSKFPIDKSLSDKICLQLRRREQKSISFGLKSIEVIKLKMHGNKFVENFSDRPNSIIHNEDLPAKTVKEINNYLEKYPETSIETVNSLYDQLLL